MVGADCDGDETPRPIFRDIRRYCCEDCGICRSKKSLIVAHMRSQHKEELDNEEVISGKNCETNKSNTCDKCGATFKKPTYLKQHMHSHLLEESNLRTHVKAVHLELKPYVCCHPDCGKWFFYQHARDHHEQTGCHVYTPGDFVEANE